MISIQDPQQIKLGKKKEKDIVIFIDMDGVCTFWEKQAAETCGIDYKDDDIREQLMSESKKIEDFLDGGEEDLWNKIDDEGEEWWEKMEKLPWAEDLYELCKKESESVFYLSSPSNNPVCASGKMRWMDKHHGEDFKDYLLGWPKWACAGPNKILIDDDEKKGKKFEEAGGHWFKWPHPLKIMDGKLKIEDVLEDLKSLIKKVKNE